MNIEAIAYLTKVLSVSEGFQPKAPDPSPSPQQPGIQWYFIDLSATYYRDVPNTNSNEQKIVVNVINDNSPPKSILKSNHDGIMNKKQINTSPNTVIGSQTMKDLSQVVNNRPESDSPGKSTPISTGTSFTTPQPTYYTTQQPEFYTLMPSNVYLTTTYFLNVYNFYPFVYFQY